MTPERKNKMIPEYGDEDLKDWKNVPHE